MNAVEFGVNVFVALFALLDPIGNIPIFAAATAGATLSQRLSVNALLTAFVIAFMVFFFFTGLALLDFFGISLAAFRIGGGILLFMLGLEMVEQNLSWLRRTSSTTPSPSSGRTWDALRGG